MERIRRLVWRNEVSSKLLWIAVTALADAAGRAGDEGLLVTAAATCHYNFSHRAPQISSILAGLAKARGAKCARERRVREMRTGTFLVVTAVAGLVVVGTAIAAMPGGGVGH